MNNNNNVKPGHSVAPLQRRRPRWPASLWAGLTALLCLLSVPTLAQVVTLTGKDMAALTGQPASLYRFFRVDSDQLTPVPHQWIDGSAQPYPYFPQDDSTTLLGTAGTLDEQDQLLLRFEDGGPRLTTASTEEVVGELAVTHGGQTRYFYVVKNAYLQNTQRYVHFNPKEMVVKSTDYALFMADQNLLKWQDFFYRGFKSQGENNGQQRQSILDTLKLRLSAGVFKKTNRVTLTNDNLEPTIREIIRGPLATLVYATTSVKVAKIPVLKIHNYFVMMPQRIDIHSRFTLPGIANTVLDSPAVDISMDGNNLYGSELQTSWTGDQVAVTDDHLSKTEKAMLATPMKGKNWLWFDTQRGFAMLAQLDFIKGFQRPARLLFQDDAALANPPERFTGQLPNVGFSLTDIPFGKEYYFITRLFFRSGPDHLAPAAYAKQTLTRATARFKAVP